jgi:putative transcriptional regulator
MRSTDLPKQGEERCSANCINKLSNNKNTKLRVDELYLISLAIDVDPCIVLKEVCKELKLASKN